MAGSTDLFSAAPIPAGPPLWLLAELTYQCPLHCVFCYNPTRHAQVTDELTTAQWVDVMTQARKLGAAQLGFSGGEPLLRDDLEELVQEAHHLGYYTNLITSGVGLTPARAQKLKDAGLDHVQLSFQDSTKELNDFLSHTKTFELKQRVARLIKQHDWPMVLNCVLHRHNLPHVRKIIDMAVALEAEYLELANTQYYGWAWVNRDHLMPTREELAAAEAEVNAFRAEQDAMNPAQKCRVLFVVPDYFEERPKACMNGWGAVFLSIAPDGLAMPCHNARDLPGLRLPKRERRARRRHLAAQHRLQHLPRRRLDEAQLPQLRRAPQGLRRLPLPGLPAHRRTRPRPTRLCSKSAHHEKVVAVVRDAPRHRSIPIVFRSDAQSRALHPNEPPRSASAAVAAPQGGAFTASGGRAP